DANGDLRNKIKFIQINNKYKGRAEITRWPQHRSGDQDEKVGSLYSSLSCQLGGHSTVYDWTNGLTKSGAMNGLMVLTEIVPCIRAAHVIDRNASNLGVLDVLKD